MKFSFPTLFGAGCLAVGLLVAQPQASAVPITGSIGFAGSGGASFSGGATGSNTGVTTTVSFGSMSIAARNGTYASVPLGTPVTLQNFSFTGGGPGNNATLLTPQTEWTFTIGATTYSFFFASLDPTSAGANQSAISLNGMGTLSVTGFDTTTGSFAISGTGSGGSYSILFASNTALPDGGTAVALLGIALIGIEGLRRKLAVQATA